MSRHWKPEGDLARIKATRQRWPNGAVAGLALVAATCLCVAVVLYHVAGPNDVFENPSE